MAFDPAKVFPVGGSVAGSFSIVERLGGEMWRGRYRGRDRDGRPVLVTTGGKQTRPTGEVTAALRFGVDGVARLRHIGPLEGHPSAHALDAMVEDEPAGRPASELPLPLEPAAAAALAGEVGQVMGRLHQEGAALGRLVPELIYVDEVDGRWALTAIAPRAPLFLRTATLPNFGLAQLFSGAFQAPELATGIEPTEAADAFVLGLLLASWLGGLFPFEGSDVPSQTIAINFGKRRALELPAPCDRLVDRALERSPERRIPFRELVAELSG
jgi:hypothetical protein